MGTKAGVLLWNRQRLTLAAGLTTIDTGLRQVGKAFGNMSPNEPPLGVSAAPPGPPDGTAPASRVMVIPMPVGYAAWINITHGEPFVDPATGTIKVTFANSDKTPATVNVLFWNPHSVPGPGQADTYNEAA
jgi:hypothetical protein